MSLSFSSAKCLAILAAVIVPAALITGCGAGAPAATDMVVTGLHGIAHGGPNPVTQATITLYATSTAAYGSASTQLAQTTSDNSGSFTFTGAATCPAGQQAYVTASGGDTGGNANNPNVLLMAAIGPCENLSTSTNVFMSEVSTVAAGYALSNFIGITGTTVHISAPASNNAVTPSCTGTGSSMVCNAAGLAHAFLNAANLVNAVSTTGFPTGAAYTTTPGNTNGIVPTLLINTLGNILEACVNSTGGTAGDTTSCGKLFTNTTPPTTSTASPITPTNTLQAVVNLAKFPTMTPAQETALFALVPPQQFFAPALAAQPPDYTLAILYTGPTSSTNYVYDFFTVADVTDTTYTFSETGNGSGPVTVDAMASNGTGGFVGPTITGAECSAGSPCAAGVDSVGHLWLANTNGTNLNVYEINTATGGIVGSPFTSVGTAPNSAAVDKFNNVYVTSANTSTPNLYMKAPTDSAFSQVLAGSGPAPVTEANNPPEYIAIDGAGSIWNTNFNSTANTTSLSSYLQNTGSTAPAFGNSLVVTAPPASIGSVESVSLDSANNGWVNNIANLYKVAPGATAVTTSFPISGLGGSSTTVKAATSARFSTLDGDGNIILPDNTTTSVVWQFYNATGKFVYFAPCIGNSGTACFASTATPRQPILASSRNALTDSTGSVWISNPIAATTSTTLGNLVQIIGTAAPTWGQLSYGHPGVRP